jgi:uncharacterized protein involved in exopolysaccharide biosynthesis
LRDSFDAFDYLNYLQRHWLVIAAAVVVALLVALSVSLLLPKRYTATVSILIEPPGSNDVRTATAVSPVYLESLRSYERFASSDSLFAQAVQRFQLQDAQGRPAIESLKRRVLKVSKIRDTRILEMSATLEDPKLAHELIEYLAQQTVELSRSENVASDSEMIQESRNQFAAAQARLESARQAAVTDAKLEKPETLSGKVAALLELQVDVRRQLLGAQTEAAGYQDREQSAKAQEADFARQERAAAQARAAVLEKRAGEVDRALATESALLSRRTAREQEIDSELKSAQAAFEAASARVRDLESAAGNRGERLRIVDPGIIPQRPSSPDVPLNVTVGVVLALTASIIYLSLRFAFREREGPRLQTPMSRGGISA